MEHFEDYCEYHHKYPRSNTEITISSVSNDGNTKNIFNKKNYAMQFYTPKIDKGSDYKRYSGGQQLGGLANNSLSPVKPSLSPNICKYKKDTSVDILVSSPKKSLNPTIQTLKQNL